MVKKSRNAVFVATYETNTIVNYSSLAQQQARSSASVPTFYRNYLVPNIKQMKVAALISFDVPGFKLYNQKVRLCTILLLWRPHVLECAESYPRAPLHLPAANCALVGGPSANFWIRRRTFSNDHDEIIKDQSIVHAGNVASVVWPKDGVTE